MLVLDRSSYPRTYEITRDKRYREEYRVRGQNSRVPDLKMRCALRRRSAHRGDGSTEGGFPSPKRSHAPAALFHQREAWVTQGSGRKDAEEGGEE